MKTLTLMLSLCIACVVFVPASAHAQFIYQQAVEYQNAQGTPRYTQHSTTSRTRRQAAEFTKTKELEEQLRRTTTGRSPRFLRREIDRFKRQLVPHSTERTATLRSTKKSISPFLIPRNALLWQLQQQR